MHWWSNFKFDVWKIKLYSSNLKVTTYYNRKSSYWNKVSFSRHQIWSCSTSANIIRFNGARWRETSHARSLINLTQIDRTSSLIKRLQKLNRIIALVIRVRASSSSLTLIWRDPKMMQFLMKRYLSFIKASL